VTRASRPPKPAVAPARLGVASKPAAPLRTASINSLPIRSTQRSGKPSVLSTLIVALDCGNWPTSFVSPRLRTPYCRPVRPSTSIVIWLGRVPRTSTETCVQVSASSPGAVAPAATEKRASPASTAVVFEMSPPASRTRSTRSEPRCRA
jgi:hypothetical protein